MSVPDAARDHEIPALRLLSLGAGVQSTTVVLLLACEGVIPRFDAAITAEVSA